MDLHCIPITEPDGAGKYIIFRPLAGLAFVGNQAMADLARRIAEHPDDPPPEGDVGTFLESIGFLQPDPAPPPAKDGEFRPTQAVLLLTNRCQLRCTYCYASAGENPAYEMPAALGRLAVDAVHRNAVDKGQPYFELSFHGGGEPTIAWGILQDAVTYARGKDRRAKITLTSNGMWTPAQTEWLIEHIDGLSLSMDGRPQTQDAHRPMASGKPSSGLVLENMRAMDRRNYPYRIRLTATAPWEDFAGDIRFLCEETGCRFFQVEPAYNTARGGHGQADAGEAIRFGEAFLEAFTLAKKAGRHLHYSGARLGTRSTHFCTAPFDALIVNASADLVACYEVADAGHPLAGISVIGTVRDGAVRIDPDARERLHRMMAERREACRDCFCYWSCAGDCYTRTFHPGAGGHMRREARCDVNRWILERLLLDGIADGGGVWRAADMRWAGGADGFEGR